MQRCAVDLVIGRFSSVTRRGVSVWPDMVTTIADSPIQLDSSWFARLDLEFPFLPLALPFPSPSSSLSLSCFYLRSDSSVTTPHLDLFVLCVSGNRWGNGNREPEIILHYSNALPTSTSYFISIYSVTWDQKLSGICMSISCRIEAPSHPPPCFHN